MTTAEGGMVVAEDLTTLLDCVRLLRGRGITTATRQQLNGRTPGYDVTALGWNYQMDELRAAIGLVQLRSLPGWNVIRRDLDALYRAELNAACPEICVPFGGIHAASAHHFLPVVLPVQTDRAEVIRRLSQANISTDNSLHIHSLPSRAVPRRASVLELTETDHLSERK